MTEPARPSLARLALQHATARSTIVWFPLAGMLVAWAIVAQSLVPDIDHGVFLWVGHVMREGGLPYLHSSETKGPIAHLLWALAFAAAPVRESTLRAFDAMLWVGAMWLAALVARQTWPRAPRDIAVTAAAFLGAAHVSAGFGNTAQPDEWGGWLVLASLLVALQARTWMGCVGAGVLVACAAGIKPSFALFGAVPWLAVVGPGAIARTTAARARVTAWLLAGVLLALVLVVAWFASVGALDAMLDVHLRFNLQAYAPQRSEGPTSTLGVLWRELPPSWAILAPLSIVGLWRLWRAIDLPRARGLALALGAWVVLAIINTAVQGKYWQYHFLPGAPPLAILASVACMPARRTPGLDRWYPGIVTAVAVCVMGMQLGVIGSWYRRLLTGRPLDDWYAWGGARTELQGGLPSVGAYIKARTTPGTPILIFAQDAALYTFADRWPPTRFGINLALILGDDRPQRRRFRAEFLQDIDRRPPARIVLWDDDRNTLLRRSSREYLLEFPEFARVLRERYVRDTVIGPFEVLRHRAATR